MTDPGTGLAILGGAQLSKDLVVKMLGPTADYIGAGIRDWTERRVHNVQRVFANANRMLLPGEIDRPGAIPPRVLKAVLDEAQFADDELTAEYLGGVLASSRTEIGRDDRAATYSALISRLSTYQLRLHYALYESARQALTGRNISLAISDERAREARLFWDLDAARDAMAFSDEEHLQYPEIFRHCLQGFVRESLISDVYALGGPELLRRHVGNLAFPSYGLVAALTPLGVSLFVIAHGKKTGDPLARYLEVDEKFAFEIDVEIQPCVATKDLPQFGPSSLAE